MPINRLADALHYERDPLNPLDRVLALQDPYSFEYKMLIDLYQADVDAHELCVQFMANLLQARQEEVKAYERAVEVKLLKMEEKEKRQSAIARNDQIRQEHRVAARTAAVKQSQRLNELQYVKEQKTQVLADLSVINQEISRLEAKWTTELSKAADKFIDDNFTRENGKLVSKKNPNIELLDGAEDVIKKIYTDAKSPADLVKYNPELADNIKDNPERMMVIDDVRKEVKMAKKIDKIVAQDVRDEANKDRKIIVRRIVRDKDGNPVYETDASGKKKVKTERVELTPETTKLKDAQATDESTKKKKAQLVCLGDVCFLRDEVIDRPVTHSHQQTEVGVDLAEVGVERKALEEKRDVLQKKEEVLLKEVAPMKAEEVPDQQLIDVKAATQEKPAEIPEAPPPPPPSNIKK